MSSMYLDFNMIRKKSCLNIYLYNITNGFGLELYKWQNCGGNKLGTLEIIKNVIQLKDDLLIIDGIAHVIYLLLQYGVYYYIIITYLS